MKETNQKQEAFNIAAYGGVLRMLGYNLSDTDALLLYLAAQKVLEKGDSITFKDIMDVKTKAKQAF